MVSSPARRYVNRNVGGNISRQTIPHLLLAFGGYLGSTPGIEIWQCQVKLAPLATGEDFTSDIATATTRVNAIVGNLPTLLAAPITAGTKLLMGLCSFTASMTWIKLNAFGSNTLQINPVTNQASFAAVSGTLSGTGVPFSTGLCFEHRTVNRSRGFGSHGRLTIPGAPQVDGNSGKITQIGTTLTIAQAQTLYGTWLAKLNLQQGADTSYAFYPAIIYGTDSTKVYKIGGVTRAPVASKVDSFYLSTVPAITRSRINKLSKPFTPSNVVYGAVNA